MGDGGRRTEEGLTWCLTSVHGCGLPHLTQPSFSPAQIASLRFVFLINQDLIALIRAEAAKITPQ